MPTSVFWLSKRTRRPAWPRAGKRLPSAVACALSLVGAFVACDIEARAELIRPVRALASSNAGSGGATPRWHVDSLVLGAQRFNVRTGSNRPYGLTGYDPCGASRAQRDGGLADLPTHESYVREPAAHPKPQGMWLSAEGDHQAAWIEFELPEVTELEQVWIWNWNDGPEVGRRVKRLSLQTSTKTTRPGQLGKVVYDVRHGARDLPDLLRVAGRRPDLIFRFPRGTRSRYVRLHGLQNFGPDRSLGLAEVFFFSPHRSSSKATTKSARPVISSAPWHLFLDNHSLARSTGFRRVLHSPRARGIVLRGNKPWETRGLTPLYVGRRRDGRLECYYRAHGPRGSLDAYAVSRDGIRWEKPELGLVTYNGSKKNNLIPIGQPRDLLLHGNVRDPARRFTLHFRGNPAPVVFAAQTPDFLTDPQWRKKLVASGGHQPSYWNTLEFWDDQHNEWVAMRQAPNHPPVRCGGRYASPDLKRWKLAHFLYPDAEDSSDPRSFDEVYGILSIYSEGMVLGFAYWFHGDRTHPNPRLYEDGHNRPTTQEGWIGKSVSKGTMDVRLVTSRDGGRTWSRLVSRKPWIAHGTEQDSYDRLVRIDCPPFRNGDEDWFYCSGYDGDHSAGNGYYRDRANSRIAGTLYTQKHNRYVSLTAGNVPQILITRPVRVTGKTLELNVDASRGEVQVGIAIDKVISHPQGAWKFQAILPHWMPEDRWERSHLLSGFGLRDSDPVRANCIAHAVRFAKQDVSTLLGKTVRLYFRVRDADLYGFRFR